MEWKGEIGKGPGADMVWAPKAPQRCERRAWTNEQMAGSERACVTFQGAFIMHATWPAAFFDSMPALRPPEQGAGADPGAGAGAWRVELLA